MDRVLVTGGAGYIGSHTVLALLDAGHQPVVYDDLSAGCAAAVPASVDLIRGDLFDSLALSRALQRVDSVVHFAGLIEAGASMRDPGAYFHANAGGTLALLRAMDAAGVRRLIFSSTAAVYGEPEEVPIREGARKAPASPYGESKLAAERMIEWFNACHGIANVRLRYFNAAGADPHGRAGETHVPETHLIPLVLEVAAGKRAAIRLFGEDYPTPDGTCVRDFVHVSDLASAHVSALEVLRTDCGSHAYNVGTGSGVSVREVIDMARTVTGAAIPVESQPRRPGDPAQLVADASRARAELRWSPRRSSLATIVEDAWRWMQHGCASGSPT
jgi:UDP-glucose 4-epimerase